MTDLEITRLCAKAVGLVAFTSPDAPVFTFYAKWYQNVNTCVPDLQIIRYDPLHDDAQAMALVKKFQLFITFNRGHWTVSSGIGGHDKTGAQYPDLNRAICECVAKMQQAKKK